MINYAHRGASEYAPENTLSSFYLGLLQGANGLETDVQKTRDGVLVLFHDETLDRVSDHSGKLADYTFQELQKVKVFGNCTTGFYDRIITLREFLENFAQRDLRFAIELKGPDVEEETLAMIKEFGIMEKTTFTSFQYEYVAKIKALDPCARVGWIVSQVDDTVLQKLHAIGAEEIVPKADPLTAEQIKICRDAGLGVRGCCVFTLRLMRKLCQMDVDGMTVNFPDRLREYLSFCDESAPKKTLSSEK